MNSNRKKTIENDDASPGKNKKTHRTWRGVSEPQEDKI